MVAPARRPARGRKPTGPTKPPRPPRRKKPGLGDITGKRNPPRGGGPGRVKPIGPGKPGRPPRKPGGPGGISAGRPQGYNARKDEQLGMTRGKQSGKRMSAGGRRSVARGTRTGGGYGLKPRSRKR